ncbi:MAG: hypothetical protein ACPL7D_04740 [Candidatus Sumerlaeaceae bacterium]|jgi:hypothetical protein
MTTHDNSGKSPKQRRVPRSRRFGPHEAEQIYRVEGLGRRGIIRYVKVFGRPGTWRIRGMDGLDIVVRAATVEEAVRRARRQIPFRPIVIRRITPEELRSTPVVIPPSATRSGKKP